MTRKKSIVCIAIGISVAFLFDIAVSVSAQSEIPNFEETNSPAVGNSLPNELDPEQEFEEFFGNHKRGNELAIVNIIHGANECAAKLVAENNIKDEVKELLNYALSEEWVNIVEYGTKLEFSTELAIALDSLTLKVMGITGDEFVSTMSYEMTKWIKDTTLLWIKNKGSGQTTTEHEIKEIEANA